MVGGLPFAVPSVGGFALFLGGLFACRGDKEELWL